MRYRRFTGWQDGDMDLLDLTNPRAKIARGFEHLERLSAEFAWFRERVEEPIIEWEEAVVEFEGQDWQALVCGEVLHPPPFELGLTAGDAAHNFRTALDHLAAALVEANGKAPGRRTQFPIQVQLPDRRARERIRANLARMHPDARQRICQLQPYLDREHPRSQMLEALAWIDNTDKHRLVPPAIALSEGTEIQVTPISSNKPPVWFNYGAPLEPGTVLLRWQVGDPAVQEVRISTFDASLGFGSTAKGVTLRNLSQIGQGVLAIVESFAGFRPD
jgi:hypothetical protein